MLCLLSHVDTVLATPSEWTHDPWSGDLDDGFVWGRGALDMKSQTAAEVAAACSLARAGWRPRAGIAARRGRSSTRRPAAPRARSGSPRPTPRRCAATTSSTRAAAGILDYDGRRLYCLGCAEKGVFRFALHTEGVAGARVDAAARRQRAAQARARSSSASRRASPPTDLTAEPRAFLEAIGGARAGDGRRGRARARARARAARSCRCSSRCSASSLAPTRVFASEKINVIPSHARARGRLPRAARASARRPRWRRSRRSSGPAPATASSGPSR